MLINQKKLVSMLMLSTLMSCGTNNGDVSIKFINKHEFTQDEYANSCSLVQSINGVTVTADMINGNQILLDDIAVTCGDIDLSNTGNKTTYFTYKDKQYPFDYVVKDTGIPMIEADDEIFIEPNEEFNIEDHISFADSGEKLRYSIQGHVDTTTEGRYEIKVSCVDSVGNIGDKNIWVQVGNDTQEYPLVNDGTVSKRNPQAQVLIDQMGKLEPIKPQTSSENTPIEEQEVVDKTVVYDPDCVAGVYEVEAQDGLQAANEVMSQYQCWQVEAKPVETPIIDENDDPELVAEQRFSVICICSNNKSVKDNNKLQYSGAVVSEEPIEAEISSETSE